MMIDVDSLHVEIDSCHMLLFNNAMSETQAQEHNLAPPYISGHPSHAGTRPNSVNAINLPYNIVSICRVTGHVIKPRKELNRPNPTSAFVPAAKRLWEAHAVAGSFFAQSGPGPPLHSALFDRRIPPCRSTTSLTARPRSRRACAASAPLLTRLLGSTSCRPCRLHRQFVTPPPPLEEVSKHHGPRLFMFSPQLHGSSKIRDTRKHLYVPTTR